MSSLNIKSKHMTASALRFELIKEVHKYPCLYDEVEMNKSNVAKRHRCWTRICVKLGVMEKDVKELKVIWKNLQDSFRRCRKTAAEGSEPKWEYWEAMLWLADFKDIHADGEPPRKNLKSCVAQHVSVLYTQAAEQESFAEQSEEVKMETFELEEDHLFVHATSSHENEMQCHNCAALQAQLEKKQTEHEKLLKVVDQLRKSTDQWRAFVKERGLNDAFIEFIMLPSV